METVQNFEDGAEFEDALCLFWARYRMEASAVNISNAVDKRI